MSVLCITNDGVLDKDSHATLNKLQSWLRAHSNSWNAADIPNIKALIAEQLAVHEAARIVAHDERTARAHTGRH